MDILSKFTEGQERQDFEDHLFDALKMYNHQNKDKDFTFMHCFTKVQGRKLDDVRLTLNNVKSSLI